MFLFAMNRNITILTRNSALYNQVIDPIVEYIREKHGTSVNAIVTPEAKGFLFGISVASKLNLPFIPIRKAGKMKRADRDDLIRTSYVNRMNKVKFSYLRYHSICYSGILNTGIDNTLSSKLIT